LSDARTLGTPTALDLRHSGVAPRWSQQGAAHRFAVALGPGASSPRRSRDCSTTETGEWRAEKRAVLPNYDGTWAGQTSQGKPTSFVVERNQIVSVDVGYTISADSTPVPAECTVDSSYRGNLTNPFPILAGNGGFSIQAPPLRNLSGDITFSGGDTATSALHIDYDDSSVSPPCMGIVDATADLTLQP
jgi:hypothetical protein